MRHTLILRDKHTLIVTHIVRETYTHMHTERDAHKDRGTLTHCRHRHTKGHTQTERHTHTKGDTRNSERITVRHTS